MNFVLKAIYTALPHRVENLSTATFYIDDISILAYGLTSLLIFGRWNVELGDEDESESQSFSHSRPTLYNE